jgi:hypothetical protein
MTGGQVLSIRPNRAVAALAGTKAIDVLDPATAEPAYHAAYDLGRRCAERFRTRHPDLARRITG